MSEGYLKRGKSPNKKILNLIQKAKEGNTPAFDQIYEYYFVPLFRFIYFRARNKSDAEDLTQIVFLKAWKAIPYFQKKANPFSSWLYRIARNTVIDYYKTKQKIIINKPIEDFKNIKDTKLNIIWDVEQKEKAKIIRQIIQQLNDKQREVIILRFIDDLSNKEIAILLGKKEDSIRALQSRGIKILRKKFKEIDWL